MNIAISTLAFSGLSAEEIIQYAVKNSWAIEFSSGLPYKMDMSDIFKNAPITKYLHNYFPAPEIPFVLNLASENNEILNASVTHCKNGLRLAHNAKIPFFSAHAGFCIDPKPQELGKKLQQPNNFNRSKHWHIFISAVTEICQFANTLNVKFLIENNVLASFNLSGEGKNPLFCCDALELVKMLENVNHSSLGLLLDTAHLLVSANTLKFDLKPAVEKLAPFIYCIHHSENDGIRDTNEPLTKNYWFHQHLPKFPNCLHVLEIRNVKPAEIPSQISLLNLHEPKS